MRTGHTLLELLVAMALVGLAGTAVLPAARRAADRAAVSGAREALAGLVARTRTEAMTSGGASLRARAADATVWVEVGDSVLGLRGLGEEFGVTLDVGAAEAELDFDALGLGRRASRTLIVRRGLAEARLVVAAYGRAVGS
jgi:prepilin-type N-terminal cleavage/methylation domain-containing protein